MASAMNRTVASARLLPACLLALLVGCSGAPKRGDAPAATTARPSTPGSAPVAPLPGPQDDPCAVIYEHDEADYTAGGLYRPGQRDHAPAGIPDVDLIPEPTPQREPLARYGNRASYSVLGRSYQVLDDGSGYVERGIASWYGAKFHGRPTSSMEPYDMCAFTAAHKTLPLPSYARVTHLGNGRSIVVRINDRGPFHEGRIIDLSYVAALKLGIYAEGVGQVEVRALPEGQPLRGAAAATGSVATPSASSSTGTFTPAWLQVGSFGERGNARSAEQRLRAAGMRDVEVKRVRVAGRSLWRVRVGPVRSAADADRVSQQIAGLGLGRPALVRD